VPFSATEPLANSSKASAVDRFLLNVPSREKSRNLDSSRRVDKLLTYRLSNPQPPVDRRL
jgi:hypothetical protein